jgi:hypothetical protein
LVAIGFALLADALIGNVQEKSMNKYNASTTEMVRALGHDHYRV